MGAEDNLARQAFLASGCRTYDDFIASFNGLIGRRTFLAWIAGEANPPVARMMLWHYVNRGWRPSPEFMAMVRDEKAAARKAKEAIDS